MYSSISQRVVVANPSSNTNVGHSPSNTGALHHNLCHRLVFRLVHQRPIHTRKLTFPSIFSSVVWCNPSSFKNTSTLVKGEPK